jgi:hypothetical protein
MHIGANCKAWYTEYKVDASGHVDFTMESVVYMGEATLESCKALPTVPPLADAFNLGVLPKPCIVEYDNGMLGLLSRFALVVKRSVRVRGSAFEVKWPTAFPGEGWTAVLPGDEIYLNPMEMANADRFKAFCCKSCVMPDDEDMIGCENDKCSHGEWFHLNCVGLTAVPAGAFYCEKCADNL